MEITVPFCKNGMNLSSSQLNVISHTTLCLQKKKKKTVLLSYVKGDKLKLDFFNSQSSLARSS